MSFGSQCLRLHGGREASSSFVSPVFDGVYPESTSDADSRCVRRSPGNLRPLSLLGCDSKIVMSAIAEPLAVTLLHSTLLIGDGAAL